jgi:excisionase family DNA binding protein
MNHQILLNGISVDELIARLKSELIPAPAIAIETTEDFITVKEVARLLGISLVTVHAWKKAGKLKYYRFGTRIRFKKSEILNSEKFSKGKK